MKKLAVQQVQQEKEEGEARLLWALEQARIDFEKEKTEASKIAREEGKALAIEEIKEIQAQEEDKRKKIIINAEKEKQVSHLSSYNLLTISLIYEQYHYCSKNSFNNHFPTSLLLVLLPGR